MTDLVGLYAACDLARWYPRLAATGVPVPGARIIRTGRPGPERGSVLLGMPGDAVRGANGLPLRLSPTAAGAMTDPARDPGGKAMG
jgi:hypothetical protein